LTSARTHVEQGIALGDPQTHARPTINTDNPKMICLSFAARVLWHLGYPDQALKRDQEAMALAEELSRPFSLASVLGNAAPFHLLCREERLARERAEALITLSTEQGFPYWVAGGMIIRGWALTEQGQVEEGIAQMQQGLAAFRNMGVEVGRPRWLALLAEAYGKVGHVEEGLTALAEALAAVDKTGERVSEAELYRIKGELILQSEGESQKAKIEEAEGCFLKAIDIAHRQQAKSLELRAIMSLARLWQQGKQKEAHEMLADIYNWFTEGLDTKDLQEAKALLDELA
jgi:predicted ATPase